MKYPVDKELWPVTRVKMPRSTAFLPFANFILGMCRCESDDTVSVKEYDTPGYNGGRIKTLVIEPKNVKEKLPCLVLFHGGGFMLKASSSHYGIAKKYASDMPCRVVFPDYRLAPRYKFPTAHEDCFEAYKWTVDNAEMLGIDSENIMVGGDSAGGNLAAAVALMARDRNIPMPRLAILIYPVTDKDMSTASMKAFTDTPVWDARLTEMMWGEYLSVDADNIEYASPIHATTLENFPPSYIEVAQYDCLRDEGILFAERLKSEGIEAELHEIKNASHGYQTVLESRMSQESMARRLEWMRKNITCSRW